MGPFLESLVTDTMLLESTILGSKTLGCMCLGFRAVAWGLGVLDSGIFLLTFCSGSSKPLVVWLLLLLLQDSLWFLLLLSLLLYVWSWKVDRVLC